MAKGQKNTQKKIQYFFLHFFTWLFLDIASYYFQSSILAFKNAYEFPIRVDMVGTESRQSSNTMKAYAIGSILRQ